MFDTGVTGTAYYLTTEQEEPFTARLLLRGGLHGPHLRTTVCLSLFLPVKTTKHSDLYLNALE